MPPGSIIPAFFSWPPLRRRRRQRRSEWGRVCVWERERMREDREGEREDLSNRLFLLSFSFPACTFTSPVMWPGGSLCRSSLSEGLHRACSVISNCNTTPFSPSNWKTPTANEDPNHHPKAAYPTRIRGKSLNNQHVQTILYSCIHAKFTYSIYTYFVIPFIVSYKNNKSSRQ